MFMLALGGGWGKGNILRRVACVNLYAGTRFDKRQTVFIQIVSRALRNLLYQIATIHSNGLILRSIMMSKQCQGAHWSGHFPWTVSLG